MAKGDEKRGKWILLFTDAFGVLQVVGDRHRNPLDKLEAKRLLSVYARHFPTLSGQMLAINSIAIPEAPKGKKPGTDKRKRAG